MNTNIDVSTELFLCSDLAFYVGEKSLGILSRLNQAYGECWEISWICQKMESLFLFTLANLYAIESIFYYTIYQLQCYFDCKEGFGSISEALKRYVHATSASHVLLRATQLSLASDQVERRDLRRMRITEIHRLYQQSGHPSSTGALLLHVNWLPENYSLNGAVLDLSTQEIMTFLFRQFTSNPRQVIATSATRDYILTVTENGVIAEERPTPQ